MKQTVLIVNWKNGKVTHYKLTSSGNPREVKVLSNGKIETAKTLPNEWKLADHSTK